MKKKKRGNELMYSCTGSEKEGGGEWGWGRLIVKCGREGFLKLHVLMMPWWFSNYPAKFVKHGILQG